MASYRLYCLDAASHIVEQAEFEAEDDGQAIVVVQHYDDSTDRELWHERRKVIVVPARRKDHPNPSHIATPTD